MLVEVYIGLGTQAKIIWDGQLDHVPRIGEDVLLGQDGYTVEYVHSVLPHKTRPGRVKIYVR